MSSATAKITYLGHSTVLLDSEDGKRFIIDPFLDGNPKCPEEFLSPKNIDYICLTHGHSDHSSSAVRLAKEHGAMVFATYELAVLLSKEGVPGGNIQYMNKGGRVAIPGSNGLAVSLTQAFHSSSYDAADGNTYYAGEAAGIVIELESGRSVYHAGDTLLFDDMKLIRERFAPEVALLPIGDRFTMGPTDAAKAVSLLQPKTAIPIHFNTFDALTGTAEEFSSACAGLNSKVCVLEPGASFSF